MFLEEVKGIIKTQQYQIDENAFFKSLEFLRSYAYYIDIGYGFVTIDVADEILARMMGNKDVHPAFLSFYKGLFDDEILEEAINRNGINEHDMKNIEKIDRQTAHKIVVEALKKIKENKKL
jgi:hypothetical protein